MKNVVLLLTGLLVMGCATTDSKRESPEEVWRKTLPEANADYGIYPKDYENIIKSYYETRLKDPDSAKYSDFREPKRSYKILNLKERRAQHGYAACVYINAKNSYGGYTGNKLAWLFIRDNVVVESALEDSTDALEKIRFIGALHRGDCAK